MRAWKGGPSDPLADDDSVRAGPGPGRLSPDAPEPSDSGSDERPEGAPPSRQGPDDDVLEACLIFLAETFDLPVSAAAIRADAVGQGRRMTPDDFVEAARRHGIETARGARDLDAIPGSLFPVVALLRNGRAIVLLERVDEDTFAVFDPALGGVPVRMSRPALGTEFLGEVLAARPRHRPTPTSSAADGSERHWFWSALASSRWTYAQVVLAAALTNLLGLSTSLFIMVVYDRILPNEATESLVALTLGVVIALAFDFIVKMLRAVFIDSAGQKADLRMGRRIFDHLLDLRMAARRGSTGGFANTLREFETLREFFASASLVALVDLPFILLFVWVIHLIGGPLFIVPLLSVPIVLAVGAAVQPFLNRLAGDAFAEGRNKQGVLVEAVAGLETIKASGAAPVIRERWEDSVRHQSDVGRRGRAIQQFALNAAAFTQQAAQVVIVVYGVFLVGDGTISMGAMIACVILTGRALAPLAQLAQTMTRANQARTSYRAIDALMALPSERPQGRRYLSRPDIRGGVRFEEVSFTYPEQTQPALSKVSLSIAPGEHVALLGRVGSGKSTLARLLLGIYEPDEGAVLVDDTDIRQIDPAELRVSIGSALQEAWLFSGTLRQNIAIGARRPDDAAILAAAKASGAHEFIARHPQGYDLVVGERGEGLSGGQRQQVCLARALVGDPPVLLLDEPTSAMDSTSERAVIEQLRAATAGRTLLLVTHRPSLLALADRVIVLDRGRIVADGPREEVMRPRRPSPSEGAR